MTTQMPRFVGMGRNDARNRVANALAPMLQSEGVYPRLSLRYAMAEAVLDALYGTPPEEITPHDGEGSLSA